MANFRMLVLLIFALFSAKALSDTTAPSLLELEEGAQGHILMKWKVSLKNVSVLKLAPRVSNDCKQILKDEQEIEKILHTSWEITCSENTVVGKTVSMHGLDASGASVLLKVQLRDGQFYQRILTAENNSYPVPEEQNSLEVFTDYVTMGIKHLLIGLDHILFVICLVLLVPVRRKLIWVVTMFTVGHSITLSLSTLGLVTVSATLAEVFIAFSVLYAASELLDKNENSLLKKFPAIMAATFGLLHGLGFASVLSDVGVPQLHLGLSLFSFNLGIEIGQLIVISILLGGAFLVRRFIGEVKVTLPIYAVGCLSAFWFWERILG